MYFLLVSIIMEFLYKEIQSNFLKRSGPMAHGINPPLEILYDKSEHMFAHWLLQFKSTFLQLCSGRQQVTV